MSPSVLVVDDVKDWRNMLVGLIGDFYPQVAVSSAASAKEAKEHLENAHFDLAVIDIRLDELNEDNVDGLLLMEHIQSSHRSTQIIIVTGYPSIEAVKRSLHPGREGTRPAVDFIEKGKIHEDLLPRLKMLLDELP
jgi:CheY-like chemotaxis protein